MRAAEAPVKKPRPPSPLPSLQRGALTVEFALAIMLFLTLVVMLMEMSRLMYLWNTVQEVARQAARIASVSDFSDTAAMDLVRQQAIFRNGPGPLALGGEIDDRYVRIDYLSIDSTGRMHQVPVLPPCPMQNLINCINDPNGTGCVRFVRARLCLPGDDAGVCTPVPYQPMASFLGSLPLTLPTSDTVVVAESLGYKPGSAGCS
jgi:hypothetical protein